MTGRRAARPRRPPWAPISNPACGSDRCRSSGSLYTSPCLIDCLLRSRSIHTTPRRLSAQSYRVAPAGHPVAVPEKHGSTGNERPKTRFLANNFGNGGPMFGPLCRIMRNYTADIFTIYLAGYSYRWRKFCQVGQTYHWYTWDLYRPAGSLIDVIATSQPGLVIRSGVTRCHYGGPHDITRLMLRQYRRRPTDGAVEVRRRCLGRVNVDEFNVILYCTDWNEVWTCETAAESWDAFCRVFLAALDTVAPLRRVRLPPQGAPPLTAATRDLFACRRRALDDRSAAGRERYYWIQNKRPTALAGGLVNTHSSSQRSSLQLGGAVYKFRLLWVGHLATAPEAHLSSPGGG